MYTLDDAPPEFEVLATQCKEEVSRLLKPVSPRKRRVKIPAAVRIDTEFIRHHGLPLLVEGLLPVRHGETRLFILDEGDLVGLNSLGIADGVCAEAEYAIIVDLYPLPQLTGARSEEITADLDQLTYVQSLLKVSSLYHAAALLLLSACSPKELTVTPALERFPQGTTILTQGDVGTDVFTLIEGSAAVFVDDVRVGDILENEIFGAIAALTATARTASVVAEKDCLALRLPAEHFIQLIYTRPGTVMQLVKDMARTIIALNERLVGLSSNKPNPFAKSS